MYKRVSKRWTRAEIRGAKRVNSARSKKEGGTGAPESAERKSENWITVWPTFGPTGHSRLGYWFSLLLNTASISLRLTLSPPLSLSLFLLSSSLLLSSLFSFFLGCRWKSQFFHWLEVFAENPNVQIVVSGAIMFRLKYQWTLFNIYESLKRNNYIRISLYFPYYLWIINIDVKKISNECLKVKISAVFFSSVFSGLLYYFD